MFSIIFTNKIRFLNKINRTKPWEIRTMFYIFNFYFYILLYQSHVRIFLLYLLAVINKKNKRLYNYCDTHFYFTFLELLELLQSECYENLESWTHVDDMKTTSEEKVYRMPHSVIMMNEYPQYYFPNMTFSIHSFIVYLHY